MKYLAGHVQANVQTLYPVCRWLATQEQGAATRTRMELALLPGGQEDDEATGSKKPAGSTALDASLTVGADIGLFEKAPNAGKRRTGADERWTLSEQALHSREEWFDSPDRFRRMVRRNLLTTAVSSITADEEPSDVAVGLAWILSHDPARPMLADYGTADNGPGKEFADQNLADIINGEAQWRVLTRWAVGLGIAVLTSRVIETSGRHVQLLIPDPTAAVREELPPIGPTGITAKDFHQRMASALPILDDGTITGYMNERRQARMETTTATSIGPSFSFALRRLEKRGVISLKLEADTQQRVTGTLHSGTWWFDRVMAGTGGSNE